MELHGQAGDRGNRIGRNRYYAGLFRRLLLLSLFCSLVPLLSAGWVISSRYSRLADEKVVTSLENEAEQHKQLLELFLRERVFKFSHLAAQTLTREYLSQPVNIARVGHDGVRMHRRHGGHRPAGKHLAYVGPYDLLDKNYSRTVWFKEVLEKGHLHQRYVSGIPQGAPLRHRGDPQGEQRKLDSEGHRRYGGVSIPGGKREDRPYGGKCIS